LTSKNFFSFGLKKPDLRGKLKAAEGGFILGTNFFARAKALKNRRCFTAALLPGNNGGERPSPGMAAFDSFFPSFTQF